MVAIIPQREPTELTNWRATTAQKPNLTKLDVGMMLVDALQTVMNAADPQPIPLESHPTDVLFMIE